MDVPKIEIAKAISELLPGFLALGIFHSLTAHQEKSASEKVIQALVLTGIIRLGTVAFRSLLFSVGSSIWSAGEWSHEIEIGWSLMLAVPFGMVVASCTNNNFPHGKLPDWVTKRTTYPSEWFSAFHRNGNRYVYLSLKGDRRIYGWPEEWPDGPDAGHFYLSQPEWILNDSGERVELPLIGSILIPVSEVEMVEFEIDKQEIPDKVDQNARSLEKLVSIRRANQKETEHGCQDANAAPASE